MVDRATSLARMSRQQRRPWDRYRRVFGLCKEFFAESYAMAIVADAARGDKFALSLIRTLRHRSRETLKRVS